MSGEPTTIAAAFEAVAKSISSTRMAIGGLAFSAYLAWIYHSHWLIALVVFFSAVLAWDFREWVLTKLKERATANEEAQSARDKKSRERARLAADFEQQPPRNRALLLEQRKIGERSITASIAKPWPGDVGALESCLLVRTVSDHPYGFTFAITDDGWAFLTEECERRGIEWG